MVEAELCARGERSADEAGIRRLHHPDQPPAAADGVLDVAGVPGDKHGDALVALDKLDKIGADGVSAEMAAARHRGGRGGESAGTVQCVVGFAGR